MKKSDRNSINGGIQGVELNKHRISPGEEGDECFKIKFLS